MLRRFAEVLLGRGSTPETTAAPDRVALATCVVLLEAALVDDDFTDDERRHILGVLRARFDLTDAEAAELMHDALTARDGSSDLWHFTRAVNDAFPPEEKIRILEEVWRIFYSDGSLTGHEDHLAHKLRDLLNLNQKQLIDAKLRVLEEVRGSSGEG